MLGGFVLTPYPKVIFDILRIYKRSDWKKSDKHLMLISIMPQKPHAPNSSTKTSALKHIHLKHIKP